MLRAGQITNAIRRRVDVVGVMILADTAGSISNRASRSVTLQIAQRGKMPVSHPSHPNPKCPEVHPQ